MEGWRRRRTPFVFPEPESEDRWTEDVALPKIFCHEAGRLTFGPATRPGRSFVVG